MQPDWLRYFLRDTFRLQTVILFYQETHRILDRVKILISAIFTVAVSAAPGSGNSAPIGIITASGHFTLQGSQVWGNATLFDGASIETGAASSQLALRSGV